MRRRKENDRITVRRVLVLLMLSGHSSSPGLGAARSCLVIRASTLPTKDISLASSRPDCVDVLNGPFVLAGGRVSFQSCMVLAGHFCWLWGLFWTPSRACLGCRGRRAPEPGCPVRRGQPRATPANPTAVPWRCRGGAAFKRARCAPWPIEALARFTSDILGTPGSEMY